ncbi:alpha/beta fold hydrolase [Streptomyces sp. WMMB 322]|uniref:alpha/beta fold hydrolase n=1 Tax=Streptomyces sp. WMMB 322 TaxID=1286821 RepID=UPI000823E02B|nr:alpha/beta hydrolase [Streptomyces sp. WMMB 322]SCK10080.1 Pimeloyl-ACP methyl ester carboxylesterase [Streptomyces sp. WMMB 322]
MARLTSALGRTPGPYDPPPAARELTATSADGARLHVEIHGEETDPAVVLIHGWTCSTRFWGAVIRELTQTGHRVIAYDQRGHGRTPGTDPHAYSPATLADDLCAVLDAALKPGERAVLGGHSMGAMTLIAAAGRPVLEQRAAALMLCNTGAHRLVASARVIPLRSERARERAQRFLLHSGLPLGPVSPLTKRAMKYGTMGPDATPEQVLVVARIVHACRPRERGAWGRVLSKLDIAANARELGVPTAVISGAADRLTPPALAREIADALPQCTGLHELPRRGHMTPVETPSMVSGVLRELVRDHLTDAAPERAGIPAQQGTGKQGAAGETKTGTKAKSGAGKSGTGTKSGTKRKSQQPESRTEKKEETP